jgi:hypothetical protein
VSAPQRVPAPARPPGRYDVLVALAAVPLGAFVSLLRQPGYGAMNTVWAEDGEVFLADAAGRPVLAGLTTAYEGYYHLAPRLLAQVAVRFPADEAAAVMAVLAALVTAVLALFVYVAAGAHLTGRLPRLLVSLPVVVAPLAQDELYNALCNVHWPLLYATSWALLWTPRRRVGRIAGFLVVALTVTSDLLAAVFVPLAVARAWWRRDRYSMLLLAVLVGGLGIQLAGLLVRHNPRDMGPPRFDAAWALTSFLLRPVPRILLGSRLLAGDPRAIGYLASVAAAWLLVLAAVVAAFRHRHRAATNAATNRVLAAVLFAEAVALYGESVMAGGFALARYEYVPGLLALAAVTALVDPAGRSGWRTRVPVAALLVVVTVVGAWNLRTDNVRAEGPAWRQSVRSARAACADPDTATVRVPVSPPARRGAAELPCGYLRR